jgi:hypothetical protein
MQTFNLSEMADAAEKASGPGGEFITPPDGTKLDVKVKYVSVNETKEGLPAWWCVLTTPDGDMQLPIRFGNADWQNKRAFNNLRALGITDFSNIDPELTAKLMVDKEAVITVKWGKNTTGGDPWANHTLEAKSIDIPLFEADDEDY